MYVLGVILARAGSKGLPDKCVRPLRGRPVIDYTFDHALAAESLDVIVLTTDSEPAKRLGRARGITVVDRPAELAADTATVDDAARHAVMTFEKDAARKVDVRLVAATARDLEQEVREGNFRSDLYYRINVVRIHLPPLRQRTEDIPPLTRHFIERFAKQLAIDVSGFEPGAMKLLLVHPWYGNVRQLENVVERAMVLAEGPTVRPEDLPDFIRHPETSVEGPFE